MKANCYECKHRRAVAGDCHSSCAHPKAGSSDDPLMALMSLLASVGRGDPIVGGGAKELNIRGNQHGIDRGWFSWPINFDPIWLENCDGFEKENK